MRNRRIDLAVLFAAALFIFAGAAIVTAQDKAERKAARGECSNNYFSSGDRVGVSDVREFTSAATGSLAVDSGRNGGISVRGDDVSMIQVRACVNAWGTSEAEARSVLNDIRISTGGTIKAEGPDASNWGVSFIVTVPRNTDLDLSAKNGGIAIAGVYGNLEFETVNGGVALKDVGGQVRGRTSNGGINVALSGPTWSGTGLDVVTTNGGVHVSVPQNYAANIDMGTVNGGFKSDIPALNVTTENVRGGSGHSRSKEINTAINGGGAPIRLRTTNGGIKISVADSGVRM